MRTANGVRMQANMERARRIVEEVKRKKREELLEAQKDLAVALMVVAIASIRTRKPWYRRIL